MSSFSFSTTAGSSQSSSKPRLEGNNIYTVKFDGCESQDIQGVKDPSALYKVLKLKFSNADGSFEHTVFEPRAEDFNRTETPYTDKKTGESKTIPQPSGVENMMLLFKHAIDSINPKIAKDIDEGTKNLGANDWDSMRKLVSQILDAGKGVELQIKLLKNGKSGDPMFPGYFTGISKEGKVYIRNNFIGAKLAFSTYEMTRINNEANAKPTKVSELAPVSNGLVPSTEPVAGLDMSFDMPLL